jgi:hypothetical protein
LAVEGAHVATGLGDDHFGGASLNSGARARSVTAASKGRICSSTPRRDRVDVVLDIPNAGEHALQQQCLMGATAAVQRRAQRRQLVAQSARWRC